MYNLKEAAVLVGFKERTLRQWCVDNKINATKIGWEWRISKEEVERIKTKGLK
ncbi:MAG: helix-turn-helix domain-containing protein [bacterium]